MPVIDVKIPDIGDFKDVPVIEIMVSPGDPVNRDDPLIMLESDKAAMEIPSPEAGVITAIKVKIGDKVGEGSTVAEIETSAIAEPAEPSPAEPPSAKSSTAQEEPAAAFVKSEPAASGKNGRNRLPPPADFSNVFASPSVRMIARELGIDLTKVTGTGDNGRITKVDVKRHLAHPGAAPSTAGIPEIPEQDFSKFGPIETRSMSRLKRIAGPHLHRAWLNIPHVTNSDEADITELEPYRKKLDEAAKDKGYRVTLLAFLMRASVSALKEHPELNASIAPAKDALILKRYYNIGVAVDTPDGLVVPVIRDVDRKGVLELSQELGGASARMREGKIAPADIEGGTFSISSLGGIGGTAFTPIVNAPEVAILGAMRAAMKPVWDGGEFRPRLMLPLCVSYDHRAIDGALAARFLRKICDALTDVRQLVL